MKHHVFIAWLSLSCLPAMSQQVFDSMAVSLKMKEHVTEFSKTIFTGAEMSRVFERVEDRVDFFASSFDFSKVNDTAYLQRRSRKVLVSHLPDVKYSGFDVYIQNSITKYPLTNLEIHADATGKIVKDLPLGEIRQALQWVSSGKLLQSDQVKSICRKAGTPPARFSHMRLIIDVNRTLAIWQLTGEPDLKTNQQEILEMDAISGRIISHRKMTMNLTGAVN